MVAMSLYIASLSEHTGPVNGSCLYFVALTPKDPEPVLRRQCLPDSSYQ
jgi:hypothetical protein